MSRIAEVAPAMTALKRKLEQRAEELIARMSKAEVLAAGAYDIAHKHLDAHEEEIKQMESELRQLGNLPPLDASQKPSGNGKPQHWEDGVVNE